VGWLIWETYHQLPFCSEHHQQPPTRPRKRSSISSTRWTHRPTTWLYRWANSHPLRSEFLPAFEYLFDGLLELTLLLLSATFSSGWTIRWQLFPSHARKGIINLLSISFTSACSDETDKKYECFSIVLGFISLASFVCDRRGRTWPSKWWSHAFTYTANGSR